MGDVLKFEKPKAEIRCTNISLWAVSRTGDRFAILLPYEGEVVGFVFSRADLQKLGLELLNTAGSLEEAKKEALAANAELEHLRKIKAAAQRYIAASGDDLGPYSEEQQAWDALDEALTEACT